MNRRELLAAVGCLPFLGWLKPEQSIGFDMEGVDTTTTRYVGFADDWANAGGGGEGFEEWALGPPQYDSDMAVSTDGLTAMTEDSVWVFKDNRWKEYSHGDVTLSLEREGRYILHFPDGSSEEFTV